MTEMSLRTNGEKAKEDDMGKGHDKPQYMRVECWV